MASDRPASPALSLSSAAELLLLSALDKPPVVIDVGSRLLKAGFVGEAAPRRVSQVTWPTPSLTSSFLNQAQETLHNVFFLHLQCNPKERKVVVLLSVMSPFVLKAALAELLFDRFECPAVLFLDSEVHAPLPLRLSTALVVDCGNKLARVLPIYAFRVLHAALTAAPVAQQCLHASLAAKLSDQLKGEQLSLDTLEDICARAIVADSKKQATATKYRLPSGKEISLSPALRTGAAQPLFDCGEDADDEPSIPALVLSALLKCPVDTRVELSRSILVVGGVSHLPGFNEALLGAMRTLCDSKFPSLKSLKEDFAVLSSPYPNNILEWIGGAVVGALESEHWITSAFYATNKGSLPDWTSLKVADTVF